MEPDKIELSFVGHTDEAKRKKQINKLVSQMVCDYIKTQNNRTPNPQTTERIHQQIEASKLLLENEFNLLI